MSKQTRGFTAEQPSLLASCHSDTVCEFFLGVLCGLKVKNYSLAFLERKNVPDLSIFSTMRNEASEKARNARAFSKNKR